MEIGIEIGNKYNHFDDGKIRESRRIEVIITSIIPFIEASDDILGIWCEDVVECDWIYAKETDYFIIAKPDDSLDSIDDNYVYVRAIDGGWFSLGFWAGRLDVDGSLYTQLQG